MCLDPTLHGVVVGGTLEKEPRKKELYRGLEVGRKLINSKTCKRVSVSGEQQGEGLLGLPPRTGSFAMAI